MTAATLALAAAAAALPLGVWPQEVGPPLTVVDEVEFYVAEPDEEYWIIAVQPLSPPLEAGETARLKRIAATATKLGVDAVLLLPELPEQAIPANPEEPLVPTQRFSIAVFVSFEGVPQEEQPRLARAPCRLVHCQIGLLGGAQRRAPVTARPPAASSRKMPACTTVLGWAGVAARPATKNAAPTRPIPA